MKIYTILISLVILSSCTSYSGPKDDVDISTTTELKQLSGLYENHGDPSGRLSVFIWGSSPIYSKLYNGYLSHDKIEFISVASKGNSILVRAITHNCIAYEKEYILDRDFSINDGQIILFQESHLLTRGAGDPLVGPSTQRVTLGLDTSGNGIYKNEGFAAGLVYLIVPAVMSDVHEIRFARTKSNKSYAVCYKH